MPVLLIAYFLCFTSRGLLTYFDPDDVMNLYVAWIDPVSTLLKGAVFFWSGYIRPLGALFYRLLYAVAGFHPLAFHIATHAILILNLGLLYRAIRLLTGSLQITFFTVLISCFHGRMWDIFASTGTIYDILCQTFILLALGFWIRARRLPASPLWKQILLFGSVTVAAADSKEMGVALPMILLMWELCYRPESGDRSLRQHLSRMQPVWITGLISGIFCLSRSMQTTPISGHPAYTLSFTPQRYLETTQRYLNLLLNNSQLTSWQSMCFLVVCLGIALALRSRWMLLGWLYYLVALLPLSFATPRSGYVLYIPLVGCALYLATLVTLTNTKVLARIPPGRWDGKALNFAVPAAFFAVVLLIHFRQSADLIARSEAPGGERQIRAIAQEVYDRYPTLRSGADLALVNVPLQDRYLPMFTLRLRYHDPALRVTQLLWNPEIEPLSAKNRQFDGADHAFLFSGNTAVEIRGEGNPPSYAQLGTPESILNIVKGVDCCERGQFPWAHQNPTLRFQVPELPCAFVMDFLVPDVILRQAGPLRVIFSIGSEKPDSMVVRKGGEQHYQSPVLTHFMPGETVLARISVANPFVAADGVKLSFIILRAGFDSRKRERELR